MICTIYIGKVVKIIRDLHSRINWKSGKNFFA